MVDVSLPPAPSSGTMMSFAWSWGSLITSRGPRQAPNVRWPPVKRSEHSACGSGGGCKLVGRDDENEPGVILGAIDVHCRICGVHTIVQPKEFRVAQRCLDRDAGGPYAFGKQRGRDVRPLPRALAAIEG